MQYIFISAICLSFCFLAYKLIYKRENNFKQLRFFLLFSIIISVFLPLNNLKIDINFSANSKEEVNINQQKLIESPATNLANNVTETVKAKTTKLYIPFSVNWKSVIITAYVLFSLLLIGRIVLQLITLTVLYFNSEKERQGKIVVIYNKQFKNTFSFFNWIFVNPDFTLNNEHKEILEHEKIHASQLHSIDLILIELLAAVMWFNPLVWIIKKEIQLVHEYLADEGALSTGIDKLRYQALLINQVTEERLVCLSSDFNHSLIKKRMIMMTNSKFNRKTKLKILALIPLAAILFLGVACVNGQKKSNVVTAVEPVKMNVLYLGVDNPIRIAASGYDASDLDVSIDNGRISGNNGEYVINPKKPGSAIVTVSSKGKVIQQTTFRVKKVPDPVAKIARKKGGEIEKDELLKQTEVIVDLENFDFDLSFEVVGFTVSTTIEGFVTEYTSTSNKITKEQKELFNRLSSGQRLYIQEVKCKGPDGTIRKLQTIVLKVI